MTREIIKAKGLLSTLSELALKMTAQAISKTPFSEVYLESTEITAQVFWSENPRLCRVLVTAGTNLGNKLEQVSASCLFYSTGPTWRPFTIIIQIAETARKFLFYRVWEREKGWQVNLIPNSI